MRTSDFWDGSLAGPPLQQPSPRVLALSISPWVGGAEFGVQMHEHRGYIGDVVIVLPSGGGQVDGCRVVTFRREEKAPAGVLLADCVLRAFAKTVGIPGIPNVKL